MTTKQISVFLENRAGQLSHVIDILSQSGINLRAIHIAETQDYGILRIITDDPDKAAQVLSSNGFLANLADVYSVIIPDEPGSLNNVLKSFAEANIDIEYMYSALGGDQGEAEMIFVAKNPERMEELLSCRK